MPLSYPFADAATPRGLRERRAGYASVVVDQLAGYRVDAADGTIGHVDDVVRGAAATGNGLDDAVLVVDLDRIDLGVKRAVAGGAIDTIDHDRNVVRLTCPAAHVAQAPEVKPDYTEFDTLVDKAVRHYFG